MKYKQGHKQPLYLSFKVAFQGMGRGFKEERNMKIHLCALILVMVCGFSFNISTIEWCICILLCGVVIGAELMNCAVEAVVDMVTTDFHPLARKAKDAASAGVLAIAIGAALVGVIIFLPKFIYLLL